MNDITLIGDTPNELTGPFRPEHAQQKIARAKAIQDYVTSIGSDAEKLRVWPLVEQAIDEKIEQQVGYVHWWRGNVGVNHGVGRGNKKISDRKSFSADEAQEKYGYGAVHVTTWSKTLGIPKQPREDGGMAPDEAKLLKYRDKQIHSAYVKAGLLPPDNHRAEGTGENEWFTPGQYIEAARAVLGEIDLDPASNEIAQRTIQATKFFTIEDDGLKQPWAGRVWLNPPYSQPQIGEFVAKLVGEYASRSVTEAILLTHNYTDTAWFHTAERPAALVCFTRGRIKFVDPEGLECAPTQGQAFFYYGEERDKFISVFGQFGFVR